MPILDRYILLKFLKTYIMLVFIVLVIIIVIDITEKNGDFIRHNLSLDVIIWDYYINFIPFILNLIAPLLTFISVVVVTAQMAVRTEIIAILSSGITFIRFLRPYFYGACVLAVLNLFSNFYIIPPATKKKVAFENTYVESPFYYSSEDNHMQENDSTLVYLQKYDNTQKRGTNFSIEKISGIQLLAKMDAKSITWNDSLQKWRMHNWKLREFDSLGERFSYGKQRDTLMRFLPKDFESQFNLWMALNINELEEKIEDIQTRGLPGVKVYIVEKYMRIMSPFATLVLTFIGAVVSSKKRRGGTGTQIALGFFICFVFIIFVMLSRSIALGSDWTLFSIWLPNLIFSFIGYILYKSTPK